MSVMDDMLAWLTATLDRRAAAIDRFERLCNERHQGADTIDHLVAAGMWAMGWTVDGERARLDAERAVLREHRLVPAYGYGGRTYGCDTCDEDEVGHVGPRGDAMDYCDTVRWLAYGHRFDAPGFEAAWVPSAVEVTT